MAIYIGGDTTELEYNFFMKVAGSMIECPMKCYYAASSELLSPTDNKWKELSQERYDKIKNQDNVTLDFSSSTVGERIQILVELDLNGLCYSLYNGSNSLLKSAIKSLEVYAWARAEGNYNGVIGYNVRNIVYRPSDGWGLSWYGRNNSSAIQKIKTPLNDLPKEDIPALSQARLTSDNKIYFSLTSEYPASSTIPSKLYLDYIDIKLKINRQPDIVPPMEVELGEEWSILIKGFSPSWDNNNAPNPYPRVIDLQTFILAYWKEFCYFYFQDARTNETLRFPPVEFNKFQNINFLITHEENQLSVYMLINGGQIKKVTSTSMHLIGTFKLHLLRAIVNNREGNAFIEDVQVMPYAFTDEEAEIILKGRNTVDLNSKYYNQLAEIYQNSNICPKLSTFIKESSIIEEQSDSRLVISNPTTESNSKEKFVNSPKFQLLPNNRYELVINCDVKGSCEIFILNAKRQYGEIITLMPIGTGINRKVFTTTETNCPLDSQYIRLDVNTWDSRLVVNKIELRRLD